MKLTDEYDRPGKGISGAQAVVGALTIITLILLIVLYINREQLMQGSRHTQKENSLTEETTEPQKTPEEIWADVVSTPENQNPAAEADADYAGETEAENEADSGEEGGLSEAYLASHTKITYQNGEEEWVKLSTYLERNTYDFSHLTEEDKFLVYQDDAEGVTSYTGISVDKSYGMIDYNKVKKCGVDFVMVKLGQRGTSTGTLALDDYFATNMREAGSAGLYVGVYFYSQAISILEAEEEADYVIQYLADYEIKYPVVFCMDYAQEGEARADGIGKVARTEIAKTFLNKVKNAGYIPMLYGDKEWLLKKYEVNIMKDYAVWYSENSETPDFPYYFSMWQYSADTAINGVSGFAPVTMSFIDYSIQ